MDKVSKERMERAKAMYIEHATKVYARARHISSLEVAQKLARELAVKNVDLINDIAAFAAEEARLALESAKIYGDTQKARADHNLALVDKEVRLERERCAGAMCVACKRGKLPTKQKDIWIHVPADTDENVLCAAHPIWELSRESDAL